METDTGLIGHWRLAGDCRDSSPAQRHGVNHGADLSAEGPDGRAKGAAAFGGRKARIDVPDSDVFRLATGDFTVSVWVHTEKILDDVLGDIAGKYDPESRTGLNFGIQNLAGVTSSQSNYRHLHFGIDSGRMPTAWADCGRPGNCVYACALAVYEGGLYAGTFETGQNEAGHVYRYADGTEWIDCGAPDLCNAVTALAVWDGALYAGVSHYRSIGSSLDESPNLTPGGRIYRYDGDKTWTDCGKLGGAAGTAAYNIAYMKRFAGWNPEDVDGIHGLAVYKDRLYATPMYHQGLFRYEGETEWTDCGSPGVRLMSLGVFDGDLYAAGNEGNQRGGVFRYDEDAGWMRTGDQPGVDQVYSLAVHNGKLYAGTWPDATVFRYDGGETWKTTGRLGNELEVMAMVVYNGKLYAGTLPQAEVYRYDEKKTWTSTGQLDTTPNVRYRRAWSMAVSQGKLFCGVLPSGRVYALEAGVNVTYDSELAPGWRHLAAVRDENRLKLYVDGALAAASRAFNPADYDISNSRPLLIGSGAHSGFNGRISDLRLYNRALTGPEIAAAFSRRQARAPHLASDA